MALKEQVSNVYGVGLRNVGSYQVSGVPHVTTSTITANTEASVSFPQVTKSITLKKTTTKGDVNIHFLSKGTAHYPRALGMGDTNADNVPDEVFSSPVNITPPYTFSGWWRSMRSGFGTGTQFQLWRVNGTPQICKIRYQGNPVTNYQYTSTIRASGVTYDVDLNVPSADFGTEGDWHNYVVSVGTSDFSVYVDGSNFGSSATSFGGGTPDNLTTIHFPRDWSTFLEVTNFTFWDTNLDSSEVAELYNNGLFLDPNTHSAASDLLHWFRMDNTLSPADTSTQVFDRKGSLTGSMLHNSRLGGGTQPTGTSYYAPSLSSWVSASAGASNVLGGNHYVTLTDDRPSITLNCKCSKIFMSTAASSQTVQVIANMTHIPSGNMFALTGSGIDE